MKKKLKRIHSNFLPIPIDQNIYLWFPILFEDKNYTVIYFSSTLRPFDRPSTALSAIHDKTFMLVLLLSLENNNNNFPLNMFTERSLRIAIRLWLSLVYVVKEGCMFLLGSTSKNLFNLSGNFWISRIYLRPNINKRMVNNSCCPWNYRIWNCFF